MTLERTRVFSLLLILCLGLGGAIAASLGFQARYVGWLMNDIADPMAFKSEWTEILNASPGLTHPAVIHFQPAGCLCRAFSAAHANDISKAANDSGLSVYQLNTDHAGLGQTINGDTSGLVVGPLIAITDGLGRLRYAGAYSDGVRCNSGNSMVSAFLSPDNPVNGQTVIGLDATVCRCRTAVD